MINRIESLEDYIKQKVDLLNSIRKSDFSSPLRGEPSTTERKAVAFADDDYKRTSREARSNADLERFSNDKENRTLQRPSEYSLPSSFSYREGISGADENPFKNIPSNSNNRLKNSEPLSFYYRSYKGSENDPNEEIALWRGKYIDMNEKYQEKCRECASLYSRLKQEASFGGDSETFRNLIKKNQDLEQEIIELRRVLANSDNTSKLNSKRETAGSMRDTVDEKVSRLLVSEKRNYLNWLLNFLEK